MGEDDEARLGTAGEPATSELMRYFDRRFEEMGRRFDVIDERFSGIDKRLDGMDKRFDGIDKRLDGMDERINEMDKCMDSRDDMKKQQDEGPQETQWGGLVGYLYKIFVIQSGGPSNHIWRMKVE